MVETPKLSSLAGELLRFYILSSLMLGLFISLVLYFIGKIGFYTSFGLGFLISTVWIFFNIMWTKGKLEELFARILYIIELLEEKHKGKTVVPVPIHEEMLGIINSIKDLVNNFEEKYERQIKDLEDQIDTISENTRQILSALEKMEEGYMKANFPVGLDPVGAIGQAIQQVCEIHRSKITKIKELLSELNTELHSIALLLEEKGDKIDVRRLEEGVKKLIITEEKIEAELKFFKDIE